jgi:hypothetical protein
MMSRPSVYCHTDRAEALGCSLPLSLSLMVSGSLRGGQEYEECIVDSENAAEAASCSDMPSEAAAAPFDVFGAVSGFFNSFVPRSVDIDVEECIVDAENAAEAEACK